MFKTGFDAPDPLLQHVRTRVRSPQTNGVIERWFGTLKYEHLFRGVITDGDALRSDCVVDDAESVDLHLITPNGEPVSRDEYLGMIGRREFVYDVFEPASDIAVRAYGEVVAVRYFSAGS